MRIGQGFDSHRFIENRKLVLGGVIIDYPLGLDGHSDADVVVHAIIDAIIGALSLGDIGELFPDTSSEFKNIDSMILLKRVIEIVKNKNYIVGNLDVTIVCEAPKLSKYKNQIKASIAKALKVAEDDVSIKAKTAEKMGPIGNGEGIMVLTAVLMKEGN